MYILRSECKTKRGGSRLPEVPERVFCQGCSSEFNSRDDRVIISMCSKFSSSSIGGKRRRSQRDKGPNLPGPNLRGAPLNPAGVTPVYNKMVGF